MFAMLPCLPGRRVIVASSVGRGTGSAVARSRRYARVMMSQMTHGFEKSLTRNGFTLRKYQSWYSLQSQSATGP